MFTYMDYIEKRFYQLSNWNEQNFYPNIVGTARNLIDFPLPTGPSLLISSRTSKNSCTSYTLSNLGLANGSVSYLYSSRALDGIETSSEISLQDAVSGYNVLAPLREPENSMYWEKWHRGVRIDKRDTLLYGRLYFPGNSLEAMLIRRISPASQLLIKCVSDAKLLNGGSMTFTYQQDTAKYSQEWIYSTYESLVGFRGLYNLGFKGKAFDLANPSRLSFGMEFFLGLLNKSPGLSTSLRYTTVSAYTGTPLTVTLLSNPLMGHISATYAVRTTALSSFASRFDFNIYSYTSDLSLGCELWRQSLNQPFTGDPSSGEDNASSSKEKLDLYDNAFKASTSLGMKTLKLAWEGRYGSFLVNTGVSFNFAGTQPAMTNIGLELQFSS